MLRLEEEGLQFSPLFVRRQPPSWLEPAFVRSLFIRLCVLIYVAKPGEGIRKGNEGEEDEGGKKLEMRERVCAKNKPLSLLLLQNFVNPFWH